MRQFIGIFGKMLKVFMTTAVLVLALVTSAMAYYTITDLGSFGPSGINNAGQVAGTITTANGSDPALYSGGAIQDLGTFGGTYGSANSINKSAQVVGYSDFAGNSVYHAFLYSNSTMQDIGTLGGSLSYATGINDGGQVVGWSLTSSGAQHAFLYSGGQMQDIGTLGVGGSWAYGGINNAGQIAGCSYTSLTDYHAFLYSGGQMQDLGTLGGPYSCALGINNAGQVVGESYTTSDSGWYPFIYSNGTMQVLGTGTGWANDINNAGQVVGESSGHAFLYSGGNMTDLNTLIDPSSGWTLTNALGINDLGQIIVDAQGSALLLTPPFLKVTIDIEPWFKPNIIDIMLKWVPIPVAILSTPSFNAPKSIEWDSLTFGHSGNEKSLAFCSPLPVDVNCDKAPDLICFFNTGEAGFQCGDTQGILKGQTKDGTPIEGSDSVKIIPCK